MNEDCTNPISIPVVMAKGIHLFPYRTQKLSLSAPMVLGWRRPGRVGHCRIPKRTRPHKSGVLFFLDLEMIILPWRPIQVQHCTWIGEIGRCPVGTEQPNRTPGSAQCKVPRQPVCSPLTGRSPAKPERPGALIEK